MSRYVSFRDFDWVLFIFVLLICGVGVVQIHSATEHTKFAGAHIKQIYWVVAGVAAMFLVSLLNYQAVLDQVHWMYIASIASLVSVMIFGQKYLGARRWIKLPGGQHFQPSEWVKLILILAVAKYFADLHQKELSWPDFFKAGAIVGIPMLMVLRQPDLGTALTYLPIAIMGLFLGGLHWKQAAIVVLAGGLDDAASVACFEALPARAVGEFHGAGSGQSRFRLSGDSIFNCSRFGGDLGQCGRVANAPGFSSSAAN